MDGYTVSDDVGNAAAVIGDENNDDVAIDSLEVEPELLDTSSLTRRLARGEYTQSIARKITEQQEVGVMMSSVSASVSFEPCPRSTSEVSASVRKELFQENSQGGLIQSTLDVPPQTPQQDQSITVPNSTNSSKSALDSLSEYITFFFKNVENYEEMLERSASQRDLNASLDRKRYGSPIFSSPEGGDDDDGDDVDLTGIAIQQQHDNNEHTDLQQRASTPNLMLSDSQEAMAAVEAISNFRSLREVKREIMDRGTPIRKDSENSKKPRIDVCQDSNTDFDIRQSWDNFCAEKKSNKFSELGLESIPIPVSVNDFYKLVLEDKADHSIEKFMHDIGELEVESTLWVPSSPNTSNSMNRTIQYIHPINAPMAPPTAQARKEQSLTKFGNVGLCLETCTFVENVPMADCFVVKDRLWVNRNPVDQGGCIMSITFQIDFIKGTMFRRIIENTTRGEYEKYWGRFWNMIQSNLGSSDSSNELTEVAMELEEAALLLESEGQEVPLSSVLGRIRRTSRRLSVAARRASARDVYGTAGKMESSALLIIVRKGKGVVLEIVTIIKQHLKQHFAEKDDSYVLGCLLICLLGMFNIMALWQISVMNRSIALLTNQIKQAMLTNIGSGENCLVK